MWMQLFYGLSPIDTWFAISIYRSNVLKFLLMFALLFFVGRKKEATNQKSYSNYNESNLFRWISQRSAWIKAILIRIWWTTLYATKWISLPFNTFFIYLEEKFVCFKTMINLRHFFCHSPQISIKVAVFRNILMSLSTFIHKCLNFFLFFHYPASSYLSWKRERERFFQCD